jgi:hypothetical protein
MKKFLLSIFFITAFSINIKVLAQTYYTSINNGNWADNNNWAYYNGSTLTSPALSAPDSLADEVIVNNNILIFTDVYAKKITLNSGLLASYDTIYITSNTPQIQVNTGATFRHFLAVKGTMANVVINNNGTWQPWGQLDSTCILNNYGLLDMSYGATSYNDGVINNYNLLNWTSDQGLSSTYKRGIVNNFDTVNFNPPSGSYAYMQDQIWTNKAGATHIVNSPNSYVYFTNSFATLADTSTVINEGNIILQAAQRLIFTCKTINKGSMQVLNNNEAYFAASNTHYLYTGCSVTGNGAIALYGTKYILGNVGQVDIATDSVHLSLGSVNGPAALNINSNYFAMDDTIQAGALVANAPGSKAFIIGSVVKYVAGTFNNYGKLMYNSTNISGGGNLNNYDTIIINSTNGSGYVAIDNIVFNNGNVVIVDCGTTENYYQNNSNAQFINNANAKLYITNNSNMDFLFGFFNSAGKIYIENGSALRFLNNVIGQCTSDSIFIDGKIACFNNSSFNFSKSNGAQYISNWQNSSVAEIDNVVIQNSSNVQLLQHLKTKNLNLSLGKLQLNNFNLLEINSAGLSIQNFDTNRYIITNGLGSLNGLVNYFGTSYFPVGTLAKYAPVRINNISNAAPFSHYFAVRAIDSVYTSYNVDTALGNAYLSSAVNTTYFINNTDASGSIIAGGAPGLAIKVEPCFLYTDTLPNFNIANARVSHYSNNNWVYNNASPIVYDAIAKANVVSAVTNYTSLSPFTISTAPILTCNNINLVADSIVNNNCPGNVAGSFVINSNNAIAPFTYTTNPNIPNTNNKFSSLATATYTINITDANGCTGSTVVNIIDENTQPSTPNISPKILSTCQGTLASFSADNQGANTINWYTDNFTLISNNNIFEPQIITSTKYYAQFVNSAGCISNLDSTIITAIAKPAFSLSPLSPICIGKPTIISIDSGSMLNPTYGTNQQIFIVDNLYNEFAFTHTINGCTFTDTAIVQGIDNEGAITLATLNNATSIVGTSLNTEWQTTKAQIYSDNNCAAICSILPLNAMDSTTATAYVLNNTPVHNNQPYVKRYFQIQPTTQSIAQVTFYITQDDFDNYNQNKGTYLPLPNNPNDTAINNLRITKISGGALGTGTVVSVHTPTSVVWQAAYNRWAITLTVPSFSYFYLHGANPNNTPLALQNIVLNASSTTTTDELIWQSNLNQPVEYYTVYKYKNNEAPQVISKSIEQNFTTINTDNAYYFVEATLANGTLVRSNTVFINKNNVLGHATLFPNPANNSSTLIYNASKKSTATINIWDASGRLVSTQTTHLVQGNNTIKIDLANLPNGVYKVSLIDNTQVLSIHKLQVVK